MAALLPTLGGVTCGGGGGGATTDVLIYGVTPGELQTPGELWIRGRQLDKPGLTVHFTDLFDPAQSVDGVVLSATPHGMRVAISASVPQRALYRVRVTDPNVSGSPAASGTVASKSLRVVLRPLGANGQPTQRIRWQILNWAWSFHCENDGSNCTPFALDGEPLPTNVTQSWTENGTFAALRLLMDQALRDWSASCSDAWAAPSPPHGFGLSRALDETLPRQTIIWNDAFWLETDGSQATVLRDIAKGVFTFGGTEFPLCGPNAFNGLDPCQEPYSGVRDYTVILSLHGVFLRKGDEVDPDDFNNGFRAVTNPQPLPDDTDDIGLIIISANPMEGFFPKPSSVGGSILPLHAATQQCAEDIDNCWWGPSYRRDVTPNLLSHELLHLFTMLPDPLEPPLSLQDTLLVQTDKDDAPPDFPGPFLRRGFNLALAEELQVAGAESPAAVCQSAWDGIPALGKDFTR